MIRALRAECSKEGFDLCDPIHTQWYNDLIEDEGHISTGALQKISEPFPILEEDNSREISEGDQGCELRYNAVLIGNSKSIWPKFIHWLSLKFAEKLNCFAADKSETSGSLCSEKEMKMKILDQVLNDGPFDTFVTETLTAVFRSFCSRSEETTKDNVTPLLHLESLEFYWSNGDHYKLNLNVDQASNTNNQGPMSTCTKNSKGVYHCYYQGQHGENDSFLVCMQRIAKITGKYWHDDEGTKLCVHPKFGTWKAFRAVVVFHQKAQQQKLPISIVIPRAPPMCACPVALEEILKAKEIMDYALRISGNDTSVGYGKKPSGKDDLCSFLHNSIQRGSDWSKVSPTMRPWIQLRDCISVGREDYKYCDNQLLYHYTKDSEILRNELEESYFAML